MPVLFLQAPDGGRSRVQRHPLRRTPWLLAPWLLALVVVQPVRSEEAIRGPDVRIIASEERTVYEYRQNGYIRMIKVIPKRGKPYFLVPRDNTTGETDLTRTDALLPSWVILEF
jgi:hypothetical protein